MVRTKNSDKETFLYILEWRLFNFFKRRVKILAETKLTLHDNLEL